MCKHLWFAPNFAILHKFEMVDCHAILSMDPKSSSKLNYMVGFSILDSNLIEKDLTSETTNNMLEWFLGLVGLKGLLILKCHKIICIFSYLKINFT